jgi:hypothetical protein
LAGRLVPLLAHIAALFALYPISYPLTIRRIFVKVATKRDGLASTLRSCEVTSTFG